MRFLVVSKNKHMPPPEMMPALIDGMMAWSKKLQASGKAEAMWALAGAFGGGGILNVDSLDELDALMSEFPFGPFSDTEIIPIVDLAQSLDRTKQAMRAMMPGGGR